MKTRINHKDTKNTKFFWIVVSIEAFKNFQKNLHQALSELCDLCAFVVN